MSKPTDEEICAAIKRFGRPTTAIVRSILQHDYGFKDIKTDWIRRQLFRLEVAAVVERAASSYAVQYCWRLKAKPSSPDL